MNLSLENSSHAWSVVSERVEALVAAWDAGGETPALAAYLPDAPEALRRLTLVELIKVDLAYRWERPEGRRRLEDYLAEFPQLADQGELPSDLIYEEYYVRKQAGDDLCVDDCCQRFPQQAEELRRLLGGEDVSYHTTVLVRQRPPVPIEVGESIDDFDLLVHLGKGAFADVFLARQRSMQRLVALKISADHGSEPQTMAQLDHPNIVRVYDQRLLPERQLRLLYMQYASGGTLQSVINAVRQTSTVLRSGKTLLRSIDETLDARGESPPTESPWRHRLAEWDWPTVSCWLGARLAAALDYAHQRGVLHRDLKPANVLITADGSPKLADFNISFSPNVAGATPAAYFGGSLAYMSPEQLEAFNPDHPRTPDEVEVRSDIYSLGVVLWELLTGARPFRDERVGSAWSSTLADMTERRRAGVTQEMLASLPPDLPPGLADVLCKCLSPEPANRFATAGELAAQLQLCLQPQLQRLLQPQRGDWALTLRRFSLSALILGGVLPNLAASVLNITYNGFEIIRWLEPRPTSEDSVYSIYWLQIWVVNPIAYSLAIVLLVSLALPIVRAVRGTARDATEQRAAARRRALVFGDWVAWVSAAEWAISGIVFPLWLYLKDVSIDYSHFLHFLTSQTLCGLIAASLSFFLITCLTTHAFFPALVEPQQHDSESVRGLQALSQRTGRYFVLAMGAYFLAIFAVLWLANSNDDRIAIAVLGAVGFPGFALAYALSGMIRRDISALAAVVAPAREGIGGGSELSDSSWSISR
ncbi:MAG TPA: serine/threonine-protein kinase [Pirellulales bacterium]|nr:serine/threonine-protein kinase [Pirellulales bacterium]